MAFLKAWLSASVLLISREKISLPARAVKGVSCPRDWAMPAFTGKCHHLSVKTTPQTFLRPSAGMQRAIWEDDDLLCWWKWLIPMAIAVFPVPGWPAISTALPAMWPSLIISRMTPAALREASWPTIPWDTCGLTETTAELPGWTSMELCTVIYPYKGIYYHSQSI